MANGKGYYDEVGKDVQMMAAPGSTGVKAMMSGDFDFSTAPGSAMNAVIGGAPLRILLNFIDRSIFEMLTSPIITKVDQLVGKLGDLFSPLW